MAFSNANLPKAKGKKPHSSPEGLEVAIGAFLGAVGRLMPARSLESWEWSRDSVTVQVFFQ